MRGEKIAKFTDKNISYNTDECVIVLSLSLPETAHWDELQETLHVIRQIVPSSLGLEKEIALKLQVLQDGHPSHLNHLFSQAEILHFLVQHLWSPDSSPSKFQNL